MDNHRRRMLAVAVGVLAHPSPGRSRTWPSRPLRLIVPYGTGGPTDILARLIAPILSEQLSIPVVVENVPGAGGNIGMVRGARAAPDGHTLTVVAPNVVVNPALYASAGYDPYTDFVAVTIAVRAAVVACVHPAVEADTLGQWIALVRAQPGRHSYASPGSGTPPHLVAEQLRANLGLDIVHVPYASAGLAVTATLGGQVPIVFSSTPAAIPHVAAGRLRALAVTGSTRVAELSGTPTMAESGHGDVDGEGWFGFVVPAATASEVVASIHRALSQALNSPAVVTRFPALGFEPVMTSPEASAATFRSEGEKWSRLIRNAGIRSD